jgi:hypothetical protein
VLLKGEAGGHKSSDSIIGKKVVICGLEVQKYSYIVSMRLKALGQVYHDLRKILRLIDLRRMTTLNIFDVAVNICSGQRVNARGSESKV